MFFIFPKLFNDSLTMLPIFIKKKLDNQNYKYEISKSRLHNLKFEKKLPLHKIFFHMILIRLHNLLFFLVIVVCG